MNFVAMMLGDRHGGLSTPATRPANSRMDSSSLEQALGLDFPDWTVHVDRMVDQITKANAS
ncbi:MAG: hypothetical protein U5L11_03390 [Arhodomonas sp.]|nr:hypothetical protein [Arhodomonas sp.]